MPLGMDHLESTTKASASHWPLIYYSYGLLHGNQVSIKPLLVHLVLQMEDSAALSSVPCQILGLLFTGQGSVEKIYHGGNLHLN